MLAPLVAIAYAFIALALPVFAAPAQSQDQAINTTNRGVPRAEDRQSSEAVAGAGTSMAFGASELWRSSALGTPLFVVFMA